MTVVVVLEREADSIVVVVVVVVVGLAVVEVEAEEAGAAGGRLPQAIRKTPAVAVEVSQRAFRRVSAGNRARDTRIKLAVKSRNNREKLPRVGWWRGTS
jgi:hypothetical protein